MDNDWFLKKEKEIQTLRKRKFPNNTQKTFAARVGVGLTTIKTLKLEKKGLRGEQSARYSLFLAVRKISKNYLSTMNLNSILLIRLQRGK